MNVAPAVPTSNPVPPWPEATQPTTVVRLRLNPLAEPPEARQLIRSPELPWLMAVPVAPVTLRLEPLPLRLIPMTLALAAEFVAMRLDTDADTPLAVRTVIDAAPASRVGRLASALSTARVAS